MKHTLLYILFIFLFSSVAQQAHAGFFIKKQLAVAQTSETVVLKTAETTNSANAQALGSPGARELRYAGIFGDLALLFGVLGFFMPLFAIGAVLFGFIGINKRSRNRGIAAAGLILGITVLVLTILFGFTPFAIM